MPFGKYKDITMAEILRTNNYYIKWLSEKTKTNLDPLLLEIDPKNALKFLPKPKELSSYKKVSEKEFITLLKWNRIINIYGNPAPADF
jgi:hypothetical protein